jgi:hypothetical protein
VNKKQRAELIDKRADELARSGKFADWISIEIKLRGEGFKEARQVLDSRFRREELNEMCKAARQEKPK